MKTSNLKIRILLLFVIWCLMLGVSAWAVPQYMNYQGVLRDNAGNLVTGTKAMTFKIFDAVTSGTELWTMTSSEVKVNSGLYNVQLGPLGSVDMTSGRRWVEVAVGTDTLSPRLEILAVAYALLAASAESVGGYTVASSGANRIPVTDGSGKLSTLVIPTSGYSVDYATLAGHSDTATTAATATNAGTANTATTAETVDGFHASSTPQQNQLLALDSNKQLKTSISAEAQGNTFALFINGRLGADAGSGATPGAKVCGEATIPQNVKEQQITNDNVTDNSIILVTQGVYTGGNFDHGGVYVSARLGNQFTVRVGDGFSVGAFQSLKIYYLIIN